MVLRIKRKKPKYDIEYLIQLQQQIAEHNDQYFKTYAQYVTADKKEKRKVYNQLKDINTNINLMETELTGRIMQTGLMPILTWGKPEHGVLTILYPGWINDDLKFYKRHLYAWHKFGGFQLDKVKVKIWPDHSVSVFYPHDVRIRKLFQFIKPDPSLLTKTDIIKAEALFFPTKFRALKKVPYYELVYKRHKIHRAPTPKENT